MEQQIATIGHNSLPQNIEDVTRVMMSDNQTLITAAKDAVIDTEEKLSVGVDILSEIKSRVKHLETERGVMVRPLNDHVKYINGRFKALTEPLEDAAIGLKRKVMERQNIIEAEKRRVAEIERKRIEDEMLAAAKAKAELGNAEGARELIQAANNVVVRPEETARGGFTGAKSVIQKRWTYSITDMKALAAARPDLVTINAGAVRDAIRDGARDIPGLHIFQEENIALRG